MSVASDPKSAWQVRTKGKTLKALQGDSVAYFGDHVDMTKDDFASTVGVGGVIGTNFTWPEGSAEKKRGDLTPLREKNFEKWIRIYKEKMLSLAGSTSGLCTTLVLTGRRLTWFARMAACITPSTRRSGAVRSRCGAFPNALTASLSTWTRHWERSADPPPRWTSNSRSICCSKRHRNPRAWAGH